MGRLVIIGEDNPRSSDPAMALYHLPRHAAGDRLRRIMGLRDAAYSSLEKMNLFESRAWRQKDARYLAQMYLMGIASAVTWGGEAPRLILLGAKVRSAFRGPAPFEVADVGHARALGFPHPSGRCRAWNHWSQPYKAREALRAFAPEIEWGPTEYVPRGR